MNQRLALRDLLLNVLSTAQKERPRLRSAPLNNGEPAFVLFERNAMFDAVTRERAKLGKGPRSMADLERVESQASGHSDYSSKFALYCAELVLNESLPQP